MVNNLADVQALKYKKVIFDVGMKVAGRPMREVDVDYIKSEFNIDAEIIPMSIGVMIKADDGKGNKSETIMPYAKCGPLSL